MESYAQTDIIALSWDFDNTPITLIIHHLFLLYLIWYGPDMHVQIVVLV